MKTFIRTNILALALLTFCALPAAAAGMGGGMGGGSGAGMSGNRMETGERQQTMSEHGGSEKGEQERMRSNTEEKTRLEAHYRERMQQAENEYNKAREQLREHYEMQKKQLEQERDQAMKSMENNKPKQ